MKVGRELQRLTLRQAGEFSPSPQRSGPADPTDQWILDLVWGVLLIPYLFTSPSLKVFSLYIFRLFLPLSFSLYVFLLFLPLSFSLCVFLLIFSHSFSLYHALSLSVVAYSFLSPYISLYLSVMFVTLSFLSWYSTFSRSSVISPSLPTSPPLFSTSIANQTGHAVDEFSGVLFN